MIYSQKIFCICFSIILLSIFNVTGQTTTKTNSSPLSVQTGISLKITAEFAFSKTQKSPVIHAAANVGVGSNFATDWLYPALNLEVDLYNGGLGSRSEKKNAFKDLDIVAGLTFTAGTKNRFSTLNYAANANRIIPLYYFSDMVLPALQNPFQTSLSIGTNIIFTPMNSEKKNQRVGFLNGHYKNIQVSYFNDGGVPISDIYLGDREDKNYTGGFTLSYHGRNTDPVSLIELSYHKYTGYTKNAFEVSNNLLLNFMNYHSPEQRLYNKSRWSILAGNPSRGWSGKLSNYNNLHWDVQHVIHLGLYNTYHMVPYSQYWALSGGYYLGQTKIGLR